MLNKIASFFQSRLRVFSVLLIIISFSQFAFSQNETVRINELMADNVSTIIDADGDYSDWIELYNPTASAISLSGYSLSDDPANPAKWKLPAVSLNAGKYLLIFASGKDRNIANSELHTNFKLSAGGEFLGLFNASGGFISQFSPAFPSLKNDISWGYYRGSWVEFTDPTPGSENLESGVSELPAPVFSRQHGFYDSSFQLTLTSTTQGAQIFYTTNGSTPSATNGVLYSAPIQISKTSIIRAVADINGELSGNSLTQTYLFTNDVIQQPDNPTGYPNVWGKLESESGYAPADYEMDPEMMANPAFAARAKTALKQLPVISLVTDKEHFFSPVFDEQTGGIYIFTGLNENTRAGYGWERPVSAEYFNDQGTASFQINCGVQIQGGQSRSAEKTPKHSFRLLFKKEYGDGKLKFPLFGETATDEFDNLVLRAGYNNTWLHRDANERASAHNTRDAWSKDTQRDMGHPSSHGVFVHLFINGMYWGIYNPSERLDANFASDYMDGSSDDFDVIKDYGEVIDGNNSAWEQLHETANAGVESTAGYRQITGRNPDGTRSPSFGSLVDAVNLIDYMLLNFYGGNTDWDHHNWAAMRNRVNPGTGFKFFCWDQEQVLRSLNENNVKENNSGAPSRVFQQLMKNDEFRRLFADRVAKHCYGNGALTKTATAERWMNRSSYLEDAIDAESARWGDYRRDLHSQFEGGPFDLYTKEDHWLPVRESLMSSYFPTRTSKLISQLRAEGMFQQTNPPEFLLNNSLIVTREITRGDQLTMKATKGTIYFTTNGDDPVEWQQDGTPFGYGSLSDDAVRYDASIQLFSSCVVKARVFNGGEWSAMTEAAFILTSDLFDLKITEVNYHPSDSDTSQFGDTEFIEIFNSGNATIDISGVQFINGIDYVFPNGTVIGSLGFVVLAVDESAFYARYGFLPYGEFSGKLDNNGETIVMATAANDIICSFTYSDRSPWPTSPDGGGYSLVLKNPSGDSQLSNPLNWRASPLSGGSPGKGDDFSAFRITPTGGVFMLSQNFPNPFSQSTKIDFQLDEASHVNLSVYNLTGQKVAVLANGEFSAGLHQVEWEGLALDGNQLPGGIYLCRATLKSNSLLIFKTIKMIKVGE